VLELLKSFDFNWFTMIVAVILALVPIVTAVLSSASTQRTVEKRVGDEAPAEESHVAQRLREARNACQQQRATVRINLWANRIFIGGQYVIGGLLATSFVQTSLSPAWAGFLGLVVLLSQIIRQRYNPEANVILARQKTNKLQELIREAEDDLAQLKRLRDAGSEATGRKPASVDGIARKLSKGLSEVEAFEAPTIAG
jgi:hypothetical protein